MRVFHSLLGPGGGETDHLVTLGKCLFPRYVPGVGGGGGPRFLLTDA